MEYLKKSLGLKIGLFVLLQIFIAAAALSGWAALQNLDRGWYSAREKDVREEILSYTGSYAAARIAEEMGLGSREGLSSRSAYYDELLTGERSSAGFGYRVFLGFDAGKEQFPGSEGKAGDQVRQLHENLSKEEAKAYAVRETHAMFTVEVFLAPDAGRLPTEVQAQYDCYSSVYKYRKEAAFIAAAAAAAALWILILLIITAGRRKPGEKGLVNRLPLDLTAAAAALCLTAIIDEITAYDMTREPFTFLAVRAALCIGLIALCASGVLVILAAQAKEKGWWKAVFLYRTGKLLFKLAQKAGAVLGAGLRSAAKQLPLIWKTVLGLAAAFLLNLYFSANLYWGDLYWLCWLAEWILIGAAVVCTALSLKRLKEGGKRLAEGELNCKIETKGLHFDFQEHAENLNSIGEGMAKAVEERLKSERFKAELITNVSHDIKTPLTSIINYVDFLKQEDLENEKAREYLDVLDRQSGRLKKLIQDLVDASKAATGNVKMELAPCRVGVLMGQTMGEYEEKAKKNDLKFIMKLPEEDLEILADGRRLWRVFDNLLSNICKYSQPGSRVYLELREQDGKAVITYRNISKYELNITEEELMERFVRGDSSRHTEGSGLGLSIARNLVELQGGSFQIKIDGDLFKTIMTFPLNKL